MAKAEKEPHQLAGKVLTTGSCPECKKPVTIKANRNGVAYFYGSVYETYAFGVCSFEVKEIANANGE